MCFFGIAREMIIRFLLTDTATTLLDQIYRFSDRLTANYVKMNLIFACNKNELYDSKFVKVI